MIVFGTILLAAALAVILKRDIAWTAGISVICCAMVVCVFLLLNHITIGVYVASGVIILAGIFFLYCVFRRRSDLQEYVFTVGGVSLLLGMVILMINSTGRSAVYGPDPDFWVGGIKKVYLFGDTSVLTEQIHPALLHSLGYMSVKTWFQWSEGIMLFAKDYFVFALLAPFFIARPRRCSGIRGVMELLMILVITLLLPNLQSEGGLGIYSVDILMGILPAMGMVALSEAVDKNDRGLFGVSLIYLCTAVLTKRVAIVAISILLLVVVPYLFSVGRRVWGILYCLTVTATYLLLFQRNLYSVLPIGVLLVAFILEGIHKYTSSRLQEHKEIPVSVWYVIAVFAGVAIVFAIKKFVLQGDGFHIDVGNAFINAVFSVSKYNTDNVLPVSLMAGLFGVSIAGWIYLRTRAPKVVCHLHMCLLGAAVLYLTAFYYLYVTLLAEYAFNENGKYLDGSERYVFYAWVLLICYVLYAVIRYGRGLSDLAVALAGLTLLVDMPAVYAYFVDPPERIEFPGFEQANIHVGEDESVAFVHMTDEEDYLYRYFALELEAIPGSVVFYDVTPWIRGETEYGYEAIHEQLAGYNYVYFDHVDQEFVAAYGMPAFGTDEIFEGNVYRYDNELGRMVDLSGQ